MWDKYPFVNLCDNNIQQLDGLSGQVLLYLYSFDILKLVATMWVFIGDLHMYNS